LAAAAAAAAAALAEPGRAAVGDDEGETDAALTAMKELSVAIVEAAVGEGEREN
jgi:hypothetical protein